MGLRTGGGSLNAGTLSMAWYSLARDLKGNSIHMLALRVRAVKQKLREAESNQTVDEKVNIRTEGLLAVHSRPVIFRRLPWRRSG